MSPSSLMFLAGSFAAFLAERMWAGNDLLHWPVLGLGVVLVLGAIVGRLRTLGRHPTATRLAVLFFAISASAGVFYFLSQREMLASLGLTGDAAVHARVALECAIPLVWFLGAVPALAIDRTLHASPHSVHPLRLRNALEGGLSAAMGIAMLFPINYLASQENKRWDYGFFKTTEVGTATSGLVGGLTEPLRVVLFFSPSSETLRQIRPYFDDLGGENLSVEVMDQAVSPELAKEWKVKDNGTIVFVRGEGEDERTESVKLTDDLTKSRADLRKLDSKVQTALLKLARDKRTAYFTVGHDEFYWKNAKDDAENIDLLKKGVEGLNFKVKELGIDDGLAQTIPEDATVVFVTGPRRPFLPEEITALTEYRDRGGAIFLMLQGAEFPDPALAAILGVTFDKGPILSDKAYARVTGGPADQAFVVTNKYGSHESVTTLSKNSQQANFVAPYTGAIKELPDHVGKFSATIKSMSDWWSDADGNFAYDKDTEKRGMLDVAGVVSGPGANDKEWRGAVVGNTTWASNLVLRQSQANAVYLVDTLAWLTNDPGVGGEVETEEDVKIQHSKEGQALWFYGTSALVPALVFMFGFVRVNSRRRRGDA